MEDYATGNKGVAIGQQQQQQVSTLPLLNYPKQNKKNQTHSKLKQKTKKQILKPTLRSLNREVSANKPLPSGSRPLVLLPLVLQLQPGVFSEVLPRLLPGVSSEP